MTTFDYVKRIQLNKSFTLRVANRDIPSLGCPMMSLTCPLKFQYIPLVSFKKVKKFTCFLQPKFTFFLLWMKFHTYPIGASAKIQRKVRNNDENCGTQWVSNMLIGTILDTWEHLFSIHSFISLLFTIMPLLSLKSTSMCNRTPLASQCMIHLYHPSHHPRP